KTQGSLTCFPRDKRKRRWSMDGVGADPAYHGQVRHATENTSGTAHEGPAVGSQIRHDRLCVSITPPGRPPYEGPPPLPRGKRAATEGLGESIRRQLAQKVAVRELAHFDQLQTCGGPNRHPLGRVVATAYLGLVPAGIDPLIPDDTQWFPVTDLPPMAFDHAAMVGAARQRLRAKLSYTKIGFALAPPEFTISELSRYYRAALGHDVTATNLRRILLRRGQIEETGRSVPSG